MTEHSNSTSEMGIRIDFEPEKWIYVPMSVSGNKSDALEWATTRSDEVAEDYSLDDSARLSLRSYLLRVAKMKDIAHRFVLISDANESVLDVSVMFDINSNDLTIQDLMKNSEGDIYMNVFLAQYLGSGLKSLRTETKRRLFRDDESISVLQYGFIGEEVVVVVQAVHEDQAFLERHEADIDELVHAICEA